MKHITIFGIGEYADVARFNFGPRVIGFTTHQQYSKVEHLGLPIYEWETLHASQALFIAIGNNTARQKLYEEALSRNFELVDLIMPNSNIQHAEYGKHCCILEFNNVQPCVEIGDNCILWAGNHIGHHSKIGSHSFITSHVCISGGVTIGERVFIGVNASLYDHITIGDDCIIQAGAVVDRDVPADSVWTREGLSKVPAHRLHV